MIDGSQITIAIPCFNAAPYLNQVCTAVTKSRVTPSRLILVDDYSSDNSADIASQFGFEVIRHPENRGLGASRQTALAACHTPWIAMIDSDVAPEPDWLTQLIAAANAAIARRVRLGGLGGDLRESLAVDLPDRWRARFMPQTHGPVAKQGVTLFGCNTLHSCEALRQVGGFDARYRRAYEDIDVSERLLHAGYLLSYEPGARCVHLRKDSISSVLKAAYGWRLPRYQQQGVFDSVQTLCGKLVVTFREDLREFQIALSEKNESGIEGELALLSYLQLFVNPLLDSLELLRSPHAEMRELAAELRASVYYLAAQISAPPELKQCIAAELDKLNDSSTKIARLKLPSSANQNPLDEPEASVSEQNRPTSIALRHVIQGWQSALNFPREIAQKLANQAMLVR